MLSGHKAFGLSVEDIAARMEVSIRTARRLLSALADIEPDLSFHLAEDSQKKFWFLPSARTRMSSVTAEQLSGLTVIANFMRVQGHQDYAETLQTLRDTLQAGLDRGALLRLDPDLEILDASVEVTHRPGPTTSSVSVMRGQLLTAIMEQKQVRFQYTDVRGLKTSWRRVSPYALIVGPRAYLICRDEDAGAIRNFALTGIADVEICEVAATHDSFDVAAYVGQSFGAFHDGQFNNWTLRFKAETAHELSTYQFHPSQTMTLLTTGEIEITFNCESVREVAYECFRWSEHLVTIEPKALQDTVEEICRNMRMACDNVDEGGKTG
jgi:predicted DNA-binding transcriptional regulator YafY